MLRDIVEKGVEVERRDRAIEAYREGHASLSRAAEMAHVPMTVFLDELKAQGLGTPLHYDLEDLDADLAWADEA